MANFLNQVGLKKVFNLLMTYLGGTFIPLSQKGRNNGVATLNAEGKVPQAQAQFALRGNLVAKDIDSTTLQSGFYHIIGQQLGEEILGGDEANGVLIQYSDGYKEQVLMVGRYEGAAAGEQVETYTRRYLSGAKRWTEWSKGGAPVSKVESDSPNFIGTPTAPTAPDGTNNTQIATTAFVKSAIEKLYAPLEERVAALEAAP